MFLLLLTAKDINTKDADGITTNLIKSMKDIISIPLTKIINHCISSNCFPDNLKVAKVLPLYKKDNPSDINNYKPISILAAFSKIFKKVLAAQIKYLERHI